jgi:hypothetical protein
MCVRHIASVTDEDICGFRMPKGGICGLKPGHKASNHRSVAGVERKRKADVAQMTLLKEQRREVLDAYKLAFGCERCGYRDDPLALDFDHKDPSQKGGTVSQMLSYTWDRIFTEVAKCRVLCANCHRVRTHRKPENAESPAQ